MYYDGVIMLSLLSSQFRRPAKETAGKTRIMDEQELPSLTRHMHALIPLESSSSFLKLFLRVRRLRPTKKRVPVPRASAEGVSSRSSMACLCWHKRCGEFCQRIFARSREISFCAKSLSWEKKPCLFSPHLSNKAKGDPQSGYSRPLAEGR